MALPVSNREFLWSACCRCILLASVLIVSPLIGGAATLSNCDEASLRQAITNGGTITFACDGTITLSAPLVVDKDTVLDGNGHQVTLSGGNLVRVLEVNPGVRFSLRALTIANGAVIGTNALQEGASGQDAFGAGILNRGSLTLIDCFFRSNVVKGGTGATGTSVPNGPGGSVRGAAIDNDGAEVWATNCVFTANSCIGGTGGFPGLTTRGGDGGDAFGGAFFTRMGSHAFSECRFLSNVVNGGNSGGSGPLAVQGNAGSAYGGAIGSIQSTGIVAGGALIANQILGAGIASGIESGEARGGAVFNDAGRLSIVRTFVASNRAVSGGVGRSAAGGAARGGGIANSGELTMIDSFILNNATLGGLATRTSIFAFGGGLDNRGTAIVAGCTFQANEAIGGPTQSTQVAAPGGDAHGGAVYNSGTLFGTNCTLVGNVARGGEGVTFQSLPGGGNGGALATVGGSSLLSHVTIGSNVAVNGKYGNTNPVPGRGGGIYATNNAPILQNSILAYSQIGSNAFGALTDAGNNISSDASCQFTQPGSRNNVDPRLSPILDFGGPTPTMALLAGSPAIDAALESLCVPTDQRGRARPSGAACDVGAFESSPPFAVRGTIEGKPRKDITVQCGSASGLSDSNGNYVVFGVTPGNHNIVPTSPDAVVIPNSKALSVSFDMLGIDFKAYPFNGLTVDAVSNQEQTVVLAGGAGHVYEVQGSVSIAGPWTSISTNTVGVNGTVTFQAPLNGTASYLRARRLAP